MELMCDDNGFYAISDYEEKDLIKKEGWRWNPTTRRWETQDIRIALRLLKYIIPTSSHEEEMRNYNLALKSYERDQRKGCRRYYHA